MSENNSVYMAISKVSKALLTGISKERENKQQGFAFRGIDDVYNTLAPALVEHGLLILPRMTDRQVAERQTRNGGTLFYVTVKAEFDFVSVSDGSKVTISTYGEAMDSGDKATNKAMSIAYKYAAFQAFCIPTELSIDPDAEHHNVAPSRSMPELNEETLNKGISIILKASNLENIDKALGIFSQYSVTDAQDNRIKDACIKRKDKLSKEAFNNA